MATLTLQERAALPLPLLRYLRYGGVYKTHLMGVPLYCVLEPSAVRDLLKGEGSKAVTFSVPFGTFDKVIDDWDHMVDGPVHE